MDRGASGLRTLGARANGQLRRGCSRPSQEVRGFRHSVPAVLDDRQPREWDKFYLYGVTQRPEGSIALFVLSLVLGAIPVLGLLTPIILLLTIVLWIMMMIKSFQGKMYKLPWAGDFAEKQVFQKSE